MPGMTSLDLRFVRHQRHPRDAVSFFFEPALPLTFQAGQYLLVELPHRDPDDRGTSRAFTIASSPTEQLVRLTTRLGDRPSTFKQALRRLRPGARVAASGPHGDFVHAPLDAPALFIAGGIGITPFRSMLGDYAARSRQAPVTLLYSSSTPEWLFSDLFDGLASASRLRVAYTLSRPTPGWYGRVGRIDADLIREHLDDAAHVYACGPTAMVESIGAVLTDLGIPAERIKTETFPGYDAARPNAGLRPPARSARPAVAAQPA